MTEGRVCDAGAPCTQNDVALSPGEAHRLLYALEQAAGHLTAVDESNAAANLAEVRHRPLTRAVVEAGELLDKLVHGDTPSAPDPASGVAPGTL